MLVSKGQCSELGLFGCDVVDELQCVIEPVPEPFDEEDQPVRWEPGEVGGSGVFEVAAGVVDAGLLLVGE